MHNLTISIQNQRLGASYAIWPGNGVGVFNTAGPTKGDVTENHSSLAHKVPIRRRENEGRNEIPQPTGLSKLSKKKISHRQLGPLHGSSSPFQHFEQARVKPN